MFRLLPTGSCSGAGSAAGSLAGGRGRAAGNSTDPSQAGPDHRGRAAEPCRSSVQAEEQATRSVSEQTQREGVFYSSPSWICVAGGVGENRSEATSQHVGCEHWLSTQSPWPAACLRTNTAGPSFPPFIAAAGDMDPGMLGYTPPLLSPWPWDGTCREAWP